MSLHDWNDQNVFFPYNLEHFAACTPKGRLCLIKKSILCHFQAIELPGRKVCFPICYLCQCTMEKKGPLATSRVYFHRKRVVGSYLQSENLSELVICYPDCKSAARQVNSQVHVGVLVHSFQ